MKRRSPSFYSKHPYIYCDHPHSDEALSSWFDRNVQRYGLGRRSFMAALGYSAKGAWDYDAFDLWEARGKFFACTGFNWDQLRPYAILMVERNWTIDSHEHNSYCPRCFDEDLNCGDTPYFRRDWSRLLITHCAIHHCPLHNWHSFDREGTRYLPSKWVGHIAPIDYLHGASAEEARTHLDRALASLDRFERDLQQDLESNEVWQTLTTFEKACAHFHAYLEGQDVDSVVSADFGKICRLLTLVCETFHRNARSIRIADELCPAPNLNKYLSFERTSIGNGGKYHRGQAWQFIVRRLGHLPSRRAALWAVAHTLSELSPKTKLRRGGYAPPGRSMGWYEEMARTINDREAVNAALRDQPSRHLLEPVQYSATNEEHPHHYWRSEEAAVF